MFLTRKPLPRRTFLKGVGAAVALPYLDAMLPAMRAQATPIRRFGAIYMPHGAMMDQWTPVTAGADFDFSPILQPLAPFRERTTVVSNLSGPPIVANGGHAVAPAGYLSGHSPKQTEGEDTFGVGNVTEDVVQRPFARRHWQRRAIVVHTGQEAAVLGRLRFEPLTPCTVGHAPDVPRIERAVLIAPGTHGQHARDDSALPAWRGW